MYTQPTEEILDLVNENDEVIGSMERSEVYVRGLSNFRVINVFLKNSDGKLFVPRRQLTKRLFPGALDVSCGGHVSSGETYLEACTKELGEELNIDFTKVSYRILGTMNPHHDEVSPARGLLCLVFGETEAHLAYTRDKQRGEVFHPSRDAEGDGRHIKIC
jgi:isopentenyldiphosphate isomerase